MILIYDKQGKFYRMYNKIPNENEIEDYVIITNGSKYLVHVEGQVVKKGFIDNGVITYEK